MQASIIDGKSDLRKFKARYTKRLLTKSQLRSGVFNPGSRNMMVVCLLKLNFLTYKDVNLLANYVSAQGKIFPRRITKLSSKQHKTVTKLIKTARIAALLPFLCNSRRFKR